MVFVADIRWPTAPDGCCVEAEEPLWVCLARHACTSICSRDAAVDDAAAASPFADIAAAPAAPARGSLRRRPTASVVVRVMAALVVVSTNCLRSDALRELGATVPAAVAAAAVAALLAAVRVGAGADAARAPPSRGSLRLAALLARSCPPPPPLSPPCPPREMVTATRVAVALMAALGGGGGLRVGTAVDGGVCA